ncbi:MAG: hypothetical protein FJX53_03275 [Alphaproteobacteria bacterium]|nr:hypothetical protein [Alphaproteobacteria bacterium]
MNDLLTGIALIVLGIFLFAASFPRNKTRRHRDRRRRTEAAGAWRDSVLRVVRFATAAAGVALALTGVVFAIAGMYGVELFAGIPALPRGSEPV